jgi:hypothetical protein
MNSILSALRNLRESRPILHLALATIPIAILALSLSIAKAGERRAKQADSAIALRQLELLVAHLEAEKDTKGVELFRNYQAALDAQQASAAIAMNIRLVLQKLREGKTQEVIDSQESRLASDAITLYASYNDATPAVREKISLQSIGYIRDYFAKYPRTNQPPIEKEGLAKAFELFDAKSRK